MSQNRLVNKLSENEGRLDWLGQKYWLSILGLKPAIAVGESCNLSHNFPFLTKENVPLEPWSISPEVI
jgi:hypothetical protein